MNACVLYNLHVFFCHHFLVCQQLQKNTRPVWIKYWWHCHMVVPIQKWVPAGLTRWPPLQKIKKVVMYTLKKLLIWNYSFKLWWNSPYNWSSTRNPIPNHHSRWIPQINIELYEKFTWKSYFLKIFLSKTSEPISIQTLVEWFLHGHLPNLWPFVQHPQPPTKMAEPTWPMGSSYENLLVWYYWANCNHILWNGNLVTHLPKFC